MIQKLSATFQHNLFQYFFKHRSSVPYYYKSTSFAEWKNSLLFDQDFSNGPQFKDLETYILLEDNEIQCFIQFGLSAFIFGENGRNFEKHYGIIRNFHFAQDTTREAAQELLNLAAAYFDKNGIRKTYAYFHYFGMSCFARQGKLHESEFYIEDLLHENAYRVEHENIYYSKLLIEATQDVDIHLEYSKNGNLLHFKRDNSTFGQAELTYTPAADLAYLRWIGMKPEFQGQGIGTDCMRALCADLFNKGYKRLDTDTAENNYSAQKYYEKNGFADLGRMRSYQK